MTVLWICGARIVGGAERVTLQLAQLLRARGHTVGALCPEGALRDALTRAGFEAARAPLGGSLNAGAISAISRALRQTRPDVALVTTADEWVWSCLVRRRPSHTRLVLVRHMVLPLPWRVRWLATHRADAIVAVSDAVRQSLLGGLGIRSDRIHRIYNPVRFAPRSAIPGSEDRVCARQALHLPEGGHWVGFFGGLNPAKGLMDVLNAVQRANAEFAETRLLICGRADDRQLRSFRAALHDLRVEDRVHYLGDIDQVEDAFSAVDLVVMATHRRLGEALPATLIEAMACGTPVVAYATGGIPEIIGDDSRAGRLVVPDDGGDLARQLIAMLADAASARQQAIAALVRVREWFDPQQAAQRYEQLFLNLMRSM